MWNSRYASTQDCCNPEDGFFVWERAALRLCSSSQGPWYLRNATGCKIRFFLVYSRATEARVADVGDQCAADNESCNSYGAVVMLIGDSHAAHWLPAVQSAAETLGVHLVVRTRGGCPPWRLDVAASGTDQSSSACLDFEAETDQLVKSLRPDLVIVASGNYEGRMLRQSGELHSAEDEGPAWRTAATHYLAWLESRAAEVGLILDNPYVPFDPLGCLGKRQDPQACRFRQAELSRSLTRDRGGERLAATSVGIASIFDPFPLICRPVCETWADGHPVFADRTHLTQEFTLSQGESLRLWMSPLLVGS